jgi:acetate kinase
MTTLAEAHGREARDARRARRHRVTAGVDERFAEVREAALRPFVFLGVQPDLERNAGARRADTDVAADGSVRVLVIRA